MSERSEQQRGGSSRRRRSRCRPEGGGVKRAPFFLNRKEHKERKERRGLDLSGAFLCSLRSLWLESLEPLPRAIRASTAAG